MEKLSKIINEDSFIELKEEINFEEPKNWLKSVSAFLNTRGGKIIFGLTDEGDYIGVENPKENIRKITEKISSSISPFPNPVPLIYHIVEEGKIFIIIEIDRGKNGPYYYLDKKSKTKESFVRFGEESIRMNLESELSAKLENTGFSFDILPSKFETNDATFDVLDKFLKSATNKGFQNKDLKSLNLVVEDNEGFLTNLGSLLSDNKNLSSSLLICTRWKGLTKTNSLNEAIADTELKGSLLFLYEEAMKFLELHSSKVWWKSDKRREEIYDYPIRALQEAVINALIHRDYSIIGSQVQIDMYDDRVEIFSGGGLVNNYDISDIDINKIWSKRRNPNIANIFSMLNLIEKRGSGLKKIYDEYKIYGDEFKPVFTNGSDYFLVVLKNLNYLKRAEHISEIEIKPKDKTKEQESNRKKKSFSYYKEKTIELLKNKYQISTSDVVKLFGFKSATYAKKIINSLIDENIVIYTGENKSRKYFLKDDKR